MCLTLFYYCFLLYLLSVQLFHIHKFSLQGSHSYYIDHSIFSYLSPPGQSFSTLKSFLSLCLRNKSINRSDGTWVRKTWRNWTNVLFSHVCSFLISKLKIGHLLSKKNWALFFQNKKNAYDYIKMLQFTLCYADVALLCILESIIWLDNVDLVSYFQFTIPRLTVESTVWKKEKRRAEYCKKIFSWKEQNV